MKIFYLPDLGEGLAEAEVREWYVKVGDMVKVDQPLVSMETAKAVVDVPSPYAGKIVELHGNVNAIIRTGAPFITFETDEAVCDKSSVVGKLEASEKQWDDGLVTVGAAKTKSASVKVMPAARVLATQLNIDLVQVTPTGPQGLITVDDVKQFLTQQTTTQWLPPAFTGATETLHGVRRSMALTMSQSHRDIVPVTIIDDADISHLPPKTDITVRVINAIVAAIKEEPALNAWFNGNTLERQLMTAVNIGLAVDTEEGLFVPVITQAETRSLEALREIIDHYKVAVRERSLTPTDMQGATIMLSNFGTLAGRYATPIIVPPTVAILGCGRSRDCVIPREGKIEIGRMLPLSLTFDHRAVTGGEATRFMAAIIKHLV